MKNELTVNVNLAVTRETAERAVKILNLYLETNPDVKPDVALTHEQNEIGIKQYYQVRL